MRGSAIHPIHILVHGGPGTGKSFLTSCINKAAQNIGYTISCIAFTGIAASNLPNGRTIHNQLNFSVKDLKLKKFVPDLSTDKLNQLRSNLKTSNLILLVIDEISYISPEVLGQIDNRLRQLMAKPEIPFGGIAILLLGDFYQLPPVAVSYTLYSAAVKLLAEKEEIDGDVPGPRTRGTLLFSKFKKFELTQQMRAADDVNHTAMLNQMRNPLPGYRHIDSEHLKSIKTLTANDIQEDKLWQWAPIVITSNKERLVINNYQSTFWALHHQTPKFVWEIPIVGSLASSIRTPILRFVYENYPELTGCFVAGAPGNYIHVYI